MPHSFDSIAGVFEARSPIHARGECPAPFRWINRADEWGRVISQDIEMSAPRRHHYLPVVYLGAFASSVDAPLSVIGTDGHRRSTRPSALAFENDLYRVEGVPGVDPNDFERDFSNLEGMFATVVRGINESDALPPLRSSEFQALLDFMALTLARGPLLRDRVVTTIRRQAEEIDRSIRASPEAYRSAMERVRGPDDPVLDPTLLDQARQLELGKDIILTIPNTFFMQMLFKGMEAFRKMLGRRSWVLVRAGDAEFATCDRAVGYTPQIGQTVGRAPEIDDPSRDVTFPITRHYLLRGEARQPTSNEAVQAIAIDRQATANFNSATIARANRFVAWSGSDLVWIERGGRMANADRLQAAFRELGPL
jgi:hypothetical protein